jgi:hypothetical protein
MIIYQPMINEKFHRNTRTNQVKAFCSGVKVAENSPCPELLECPVSKPRSVLWVICYMLHAECYMLNATCYMLHTVCCMPFPRCYFSDAVSCLSYPGSSMVSIACSLPLSRLASLRFASIRLDSPRFALPRLALPCLASPHLPIEREI